MKLYTYYRSTAAYRVRIALHYKNLAYEAIPIDLTQGAQQQQDYKIHNPQGAVPTLIDGQFEFGQSMAMLEYLEEKYPNPSLLPQEVNARAWIRYFSQIIVCDIHPVNNLSILKFLREKFAHSEEEVMQWYHNWLRQGFDALEILLKQNTKRGQYCWGDTPTFADACLIPQVYNAYRFKFPMDNYPLILSINEHCLNQSFFDKARPENQPDFK